MRSLHAVLVLVILASATCENLGQPAFGWVRVSVATTGGDPDLDGYRLQVDTTLSQPVSPNGTVLMPDLATGIHAVVLEGVAGNCTVENGSLRLLTVTGGDTAAVAYAVGCVATGLQISISTVGVDTADSYTLAVNSAPPITVPVNGTVTVTRLAAGHITVRLSGVPANCDLADVNPRFVDVAPGAVEPIGISVTCLAITGVVEAAIATAGLDLDADGYTVQLDDGAPQPVGVAGTVRFHGVRAGSHDVTLAAAAANCLVGGGTNTHPVAVTVGTTTRDTARTSFQLSCTAVSGVVEVTTATSGLDLDADGYAAQLDSGTPQPVGLNGVTRFAGVSGGDHEIALGGAAVNCTAGNNPDTVTVTVGGLTRDTARVTFSVTCGAVTGVIAVTAATGGIDLDQNGYSVYVDNGTPQQLSVNGTIYFTGVDGGSHGVLLTHASHNCLVGGANPRTLGITIGGVTRDTARTTFDVTCEATTGNARIITTTTGADVDTDGYGLSECYDFVGDLYCPPATQQQAANDTTLLVALPSGSHVFLLSSVAPNCDVSGANPRTVHVAGAATTDIVFSVACLALGSLQVTATTTGVDLDVNGYRVVASGSRRVYEGGVPTTGTGTLSGLAPGAYTVSLGDAALNCDIAAPNPVVVTVPSGGVGTAAFTVACAAAIEIAFAKDSLGTRDIYKLRTNGSALMRLTTTSAAEEAPAWSHDGTKVAFVGFAAGDANIYVMNADGSGIVPLTAVTAHDYHPTWSDNDAKIAFHTDRDGNHEIYVMNADGTQPLRLTNDPATDFNPAWSPDGSKIAFVRGTCDFDGCRGDLYTMNPDGSGVQRITSGGRDSDPAWSPNGARLAFSRVTTCAYYCKRDILIMNADGSGVEQLTSGSEDHIDPAWSPDARWIAFMARQPFYEEDGYDWSLQIIRNTGADRREVPAGPNAYNPAWRP